MTQYSTNSKIDFFFSPKSVAVLGAFRSPDKFGTIIVENLLNLNFEGKIFPVNPNTSEIMGLTTYASVLQIPEDVDVAMIFLPAPRVILALEECEKKGVRGVVIGTHWAVEM